jgi:hypothetical protein
VHKTLALLAGVAAVFITTVAAEAAPSSGVLDAPPDKVAIEISTINGSGCKKETTAVAVATDNSAFTLTYSEYLAQVGVGAKPVDFRKNCQLSLDVHVPEGYSYAIARADYRGFAHIERGASGVQRANYYFQGTQETVPRTRTFNGPYSDNWQVSDLTEPSEMLWSPCGKKRNFNINTELRMAAGTSDTTKTTSFMTMDSLDTNISTTYRFVWKKCPQS